MLRRRFVLFLKITVALLIAAVLWPNTIAAGPIQDAPSNFSPSKDDDGRPGKKKKKKRKKKKRSKKKSKEKKEIIRWGQRRTETDAEYDKRFARVLKRVKKPRRGDYTGGQFRNQRGEEVQIWTYMGHHGCPMIVRSDISQEFTAQFAMYLENLHREYSTVYRRLLGKPSQFKEKVEIITFADQATYMSAGGQPGSAGQFAFMMHLYRDRGYSWPSRHFRVMQFTSGEQNFAYWPKDTLKHECSHMELMMRLGYKRHIPSGIAIPIMPPLWWNEGLAGVFETWDLDKTVEENFAELPNRSEYPPYVRRMYGTERWLPFEYFWTMTPSDWHRRRAVFFNYCQAWSLVSYMLTGGREGQADFRRIYDLSMRVGINERDDSWADRKIGWSKAWAEVFPPEEQDRMVSNWHNWVETNVPRDGRVPNEEYILRRGYIDPSVTTQLKMFETPEEMKENKKWLEKEERRRKKMKFIYR